MVDICDCDVKDKEKLVLFRIRRREWQRWLLKGSEYSISNEIYHMLWNDTVFRTFNEARKLGEKNTSNKMGFNGPLIRLLDEGFLISQVMRIRRLTDPGFFDPKRAVISLARLVKDIGDSRDLLTRENYICHDGTPYDGVPGGERDIEWFHWDRRQKIFDKLSDVTGKNRSRADLISNSIIKSLEKDLKTCADFRTYSNKFVAHAADPKSMKQLPKRVKTITLKKLDQSSKAIIRLGSFIGAVILYEYDMGGVPTPQYNVFENLDKPMVAATDIDKLQNFWDKRVKEVSKWDERLWPKAQQQSKSG
jgi:hypothetical protein